MMTKSDMGGGGREGSKFSIYKTWKIKISKNNDKLLILFNAPCFLTLG